MRRYIIYSGTAAGTALLTAALFFLFPGMADAYRANVFIPVSAWIRCVVQPICLPFTESLFIAARVCGLVLLVWLYMKKRHMKFVYIMSIFATGLFLYVYLWGALYLCTPAFKMAEGADAARISSVCEMLIESLNGLSSNFEWPDVQELCAESARLMSDKLGIPLTEPRIVNWTAMFERMNIAGIYSPLTFESLISPADIRQMIPFTACHELAHQAGLAREDEANFAAWLACRDEDNAFRYSADLSMLISGMKILRLMDEGMWNECVQHMSKEVLFDFRCANGLYEARADRDSGDTVGGSPSAPDIYDHAFLYALEFLEENEMPAPF